MKELINLLHSGDENKIITVKMYDIALYILSGLSISPDSFRIYKGDQDVYILVIIWKFNTYNISVAIRDDANIILGLDGWHHFNDLTYTMIQEFDNILIASNVNGNKVI